MRVLVTGHEGYLGSVLVADGCSPPATGHRPGHGPVRRLPARPGAGPGAGAAGRPARRHAPSTGRPCARTRSMHLAALCNDPLGNLNPELTYEVNHRATVRLARAAKAAGVTRFLFASSCSLYGAGPTALPLDESAPFAPLTPYGESKILAEQGLGRAGRRRLLPGLPAQRHGVRLLAPAARRPRRQRSGRARAVHRQGPPALRRIGLAPAGARGGHRRGLPRAAGGRRASGCTAGPSTSGRPRRTTASATSRSWSASSSAAPSPTPPGRPPTARDYRVSCERIAREIPEFRPSGRCAKGVEQLAEAYRRYGLTSPTLTGERHQRVRRILALRESGRLDAELRWTARRGVSVTVVRARRSRPGRAVALARPAARRRRRWPTRSWPRSSPSRWPAGSRPRGSRCSATRSGGRLPAVRGARAGDRQGDRERDLGLPGSGAPARARVGRRRARAGLPAAGVRVRPPAGRSGDLRRAPPSATARR